MLADTVLRNGCRTKRKLIFGLLLLAAMMIAGALLTVYSQDLRTLWVTSRLKERSLAELPVAAAEPIEAVLLENRICLTSDGEVTVLEPDGTLLYQVSAGEEDLSIVGGGRIAVFYAFGQKKLTILGEDGPVSVAVSAPVIRAEIGDGGLAAVQVKRSGCFSHTILMNTQGEITGEIMLQDAVMALMAPCGEADGLYCACVGTNGRWDVRLYDSSGTQRFQVPAADPVLSLTPSGQAVFVRTAREIIRMDGQGNSVSRLPCAETMGFCGNGRGEIALLQQNSGERLLRLYGPDGTERFSRLVFREVYDLKLTDELLILLDNEGAAIYDRQGRPVRRIPCDGSTTRLFVSENCLCLMGQDGITTMKLKETVPGLYG